MYVGDGDIQELTLYVLYGMYNEESSRKNKASDRVSIKIRNLIATVLKVTARELTFLCNKLIKKSNVVRPPQ